LTALEKRGKVERESGIYYSSPSPSFSPLGSPLELVIVGEDRKGREEKGEKEGKRERG